MSIHVNTNSNLMNSTDSPKQVIERNLTKLAIPRLMDLLNETTVRTNAADQPLQTLSLLVNKLTGEIDLVSNKLPARDHDQQAHVYLNFTKGQQETGSFQLGPLRTDIPVTSQNLLHETVRQTNAALANFKKMKAG